MRLIDIEPCEKLGHAMVLYATEGGMLVQIRSCDMPTIDAVPVVRCRDCVFFWGMEDRDPVCRNRKALVDVTEETFCPYGERKDGEN